MTTLFIATIIAWIISYMVFDNSIKSLQQEIVRLRKIIHEYERSYLKRTR